MNVDISIIMPVYNGEKYLKEAIESILNQTFKNFELIIINDGSSDQSKNIIENFLDKRIKNLENKKNKGLIYSLNYGISKAKGKYIARMDADDISHLNRLEIQFNYLEKNKEIFFLGSQVEKVYSKTEKTKLSRLRTTYSDIKTDLLFANPFIHPTLMFRREIFSENCYEEGLNGAEDFGLWQDLIYKYKGINLSNVLLKYRILETGITKTYDKKIYEKLEVHKKIYQKSLKNISINLTEEELEIYTRACIGIPFEKENNKRNFLILKEILIKILKNYPEKNKTLKKLILKRYLITCIRNKQLNIREVLEIFLILFR